MCAPSHGSHRLLLRWQSRTSHKLSEPLACSEQSLITDAGMFSVYTAMTGWSHRGWWMTSVPVEILSQSGNSSKMILHLTVQHCVWYTHTSATICIHTYYQGQISIQAGLDLFFLLWLRKPKWKWMLYKYSPVSSISDDDRQAVATVSPEATSSSTGVSAPSQ